LMGLEHPIHCDPMKSCLAMHILGFWWRHRQFHPFSFSLRNHFGFWSNGKRDMLEVLAWANIFQEEKMPLNWPRHWVSLFCTIVRWKWTCEDLAWIVFAVWRWSDESDSQGHSSSRLQALPRLALQHNA
jgi:hypothetical protein